jgi:hypothetical protein
VDKQNALNLFLGYFKPYQEMGKLWDLMSDEHLHFDMFDKRCMPRSYCRWDDDIASSTSSSDLVKQRDGKVVNDMWRSKDSKESEKHSYQTLSEKTKSISLTLSNRIKPNGTYTSPFDRRLSFSEKQRYIINYTTLLTTYYSHTDSHTHTKTQQISSPIPNRPE